MRSLSALAYLAKRNFAFGAEEVLNGKSIRTPIRGGIILRLRLDEKAVSVGIFPAKHTRVDMYAHAHAPSAA